MKKINVDNIEWQSSENKDFSYARKSLGTQAGGKMLGASMYKLTPQKKAFPFHFHHANEEAILILKGSGTLRLTDGSMPVTEGDYIAMPTGPEHAHQMINTSNESLEYLCFSTMIVPEVSEYPDSNKIGVLTGTAPGGLKEKNSFKGFYKKESDVDYFEGE